MSSSRQSVTENSGSSKSCYNEFINTNPSISELADTLLKKGGHINKYYLKELNKNRHAIVFLNGWFGGKNIREALLKALL